MTDLSQLTERDLLVRIDTKVEALENSASSLSARVAALERSRDRQEGMGTGVKLFFGLLMTLPTAALGVLLGRDFR